MELIVFICSLLLISYFFDLISSYIKIPSLFLLIILGFLLRFFLEYIGFEIISLEKSIIILGTLGLILIVQEAALELEFKKERISLILKAFFSSIFQLILQAGLFSFTFFMLFKYDLKTSLLNAIPLSVISSAVAISSVRNSKNFEKEFITYESAFSDIAGIFLFDFIYFNEKFNLDIIKMAFYNIFFIIIISFFSIFILVHLLNKIKHPVKFIPILLIVISFYAIAKLYHLPALLFILFFGFSLSNINKFLWKKINEKINFENLNLEIEKYKSISFELTYLIRSIFFIIFGFSFKLKEIFHFKTIPFVLISIIFIYLIRYLVISILRVKNEKILFVAPRGLITIILFFLIDEKFKIFFINKIFILQLIILSIFLMFIETFKKENSQNLTNL